HSREERRGAEPSFATTPAVHSAPVEAGSGPGVAREAGAGVLLRADGRPARGLSAGNRSQPARGYRGGGRARIGEKPDDHFERPVALAAGLLRPAPAQA